MKIKEIKYNDDRYPKLLRNIKEPPEKLYVLGSTEILNKPGIAIIGSRKCTEAGKKIARNFASKLSSVGICINSGMAIGIDTQAHLGALSQTGNTVAVLGCGLNNIYPKENEELFYKIINNGGAIISEYEKNVQPESKRFIQRNRIVSGMSIGVLVIEAAYRSGTSITAQFAKREKKPIFCIPHDISDKLGIGTNRLLQRGAKCVVSINDILKEYDFLRELNTNCVKHNNEGKIDIDINVIPKEYVEIYKCLKDEPIDINYICKNTKMNVNEISAGLTILELEGYINQLPGNKFVKVG